MPRINPPTRRDFITKSSSLVGSAAVAGFATSSRTGYAADNKTLNLGCDPAFEMVVNGSGGRCVGKGKVDFTIEGDKPWASVEKDTGEKRPRRSRLKSSGQQGHQLGHNAMYVALRLGGYINNGDYLAKSTLMAIMARDSAYSGKEVTWQGMLENPQRLVPEKLSWDMELPKWRVAMPGQHGII